jgi:hypothetical protein
MHLFTNGCSWTYGGALDLDAPKQEQERLSVTWPSHLASKLNATYTNIATVAGSNQRVVRTTIDWLYDNKEFIKNEKVIAIIQWSEPSRFEYYEPIKDWDLDEMDPSRWTFCTPSYVKQQELTQKVARFFVDQRLRFYSHQEAAYSTLYNCLTLAKIFDTYNIKYFFWNPLYNLQYCRSNIRECILNAGTWLDQSHSVLSNEWIYDRVGKTSRIDCDAHPSRKGHEQIAEIILKELKKYE